MHQSLGTIGTFESLRKIIVCIEIVLREEGRVQGTDCMIAVSDFLVVWDMSESFRVMRRRH